MTRSPGRAGLSVDLRTAGKPTGLPVAVELDVWPSRVSSVQLVFWTFRRTSYRSVDEGYHQAMARRADELDEPIVVPIEDEFSKLSEEERIRLTQEWLGSLRTDEPLDLGVTAAECLAEVRAEEE